MSTVLQMPRARTCFVTLLLLAAIACFAKWLYDYLPLSI